jgi:DDE superfamily endonuclease
MYPIRPVGAEAEEMTKTPGEVEAPKPITAAEREARKAFRQVDAEKAMTEHEIAQKAFSNNRERLKAERLAREARRRAEWRGNTLVLPGKITNCQIGVFAAYVSCHGHAFIDRALYLPKEWTDDPDRLEAAYVPAGVGFATKS